MRCTACDKELDATAFSSKQKKANASTRRCNACVAAGLFVNGKVDACSLDALSLNAVAGDEPDSADAGVFLWQTLRRELASDELGFKARLFVSDCAVKQPVPPSELVSVSPSALAASAAMSHWNGCKFVNAAVSAFAPGCRLLLLPFC